MAKLQNSHLVDNDDINLDTQNILRKIKVWLRDEVNSVRDNPLSEDDDSRESAILQGRYECAEGLQDQIKKWEREDG
tara:strand:+ start:19160 stop:19390 length:231 start_codon:yes stop_codon:yes gene_type:complete